MKMLEAASASVEKEEKVGCGLAEGISTIAC